MNIRAAVGYIVLLASLLLILVFTRSGGHHKATKQEAAPAATPTTANKPQTTSTPTSPVAKPPASTTTSSGPVVTEETPGKTVQRESVLVTEVNDFLKRYYLILPKDTAASRRSRVIGFAGAAVLDKLNFGLSVGTVSDGTRRYLDETIQGEPVLGELVAEPIGQPSLWEVTVPVTVYTYSGKVVLSQHQVLSITRWQYQPREKRWTLRALH